MALGLTIRASGFIPLFPGIQKRAVDIRPVGRRIAEHLRTGGKGSIDDHFSSQQEYLPSGGAKKWKRSQRAIREGGLTLVDTGAYRRAWTGKGPGGVLTIDSKRVRVGINRARFPQVGPFQASSPTRTGRGGAALLVPRPIGLGPEIMSGVTDIVLKYIATGERG